MPKTGARKITVVDILKNLDGPKKRIVVRLRKLVKRALPGVKETVSYGYITFLLDGKNISLILIYDDHVDFGFFRGAFMKSPRLEGRGKFMRHVKLRKPEDIDDREFARLLEAATSL